MVAFLVVLVALIAIPGAAFVAGIEIYAHLKTRKKKGIWSIPEDYEQDEN
jgi:hypothetical protein